MICVRIVVVYLVLAQLQKFWLMLKECLLLLSDLKVLNSVYNLTRDLKVLSGFYNQIANVCHPLDCTCLVSTSKEFICNKCDSVLLKNMMPDNAVNSPTKKLVDSQNNMCLICKNNVTEFCLFKQTAYGNNPSVTKLLRCTKT